MNTSIITVERHRVALRGDRNQCPSCGHLFNSSYAFDKHRFGDFSESLKPTEKAFEPRRCLTEDEMRAKGMTLNGGGFWVGSVSDREWPAREAASA